MYNIVCASSPNDLCDRVNERVALGWELQGGLAIAVTRGISAGLIRDNLQGLLVSASDMENSLSYCQAMIFVEK